MDRIRKNGRKGGACKRNHLYNKDHNANIDISGLGSFIKQKPRVNAFRRARATSSMNSKQRSVRFKRHKHDLKCSSCRKTGHTRCHAKEQYAGRALYNDMLVNMIGPKEISGMSHHTGLRAALHSPVRFREAMGKSDTFPIIWDSGASACITFDKDDFLSLDVSKNHNPLKSVGGHHKVQGEGFILCSIPDEREILRRLKLKALWVPESTVRLLSTEGLLNQYQGESILLQHGTLRLSGVDSDKARNPVTVRVHPGTDLPTSVAYRYNGCMSAVKSLNNVVSVVKKENINLTDPEKELLCWHQRLGHVAFKRVQALFRSGV